MDIKKKQWWVNTASSSEIAVASGLPLLTLNATKFIAAYDGNDADNDGWYGRGSVTVRSGITILTYREGARHDSETYGIIHIRFSSDYGATWSNEDQTLGAVAVTGFPLRPVGAGAPSGNNRGPSHGLLILCPNNDLLCQMWSSDYSADNDGPWQARSTDGGLTWAAPVKITFSNYAPDQNRTFFGEGHTVVGSTIYAGIRHYAVSSPQQEANYFAKSEDNGLTWAVVGQITTTTLPAPRGTQEVSIEYVGSGRFIALLREAANEDGHYSYSSDWGATWSAAVDITASFNLGSTSWVGRTIMKTRSHVQGLSNWWNDRVLIVTGFTGGVDNQSTGARRNASWTGIIPADYDLSNISWYGPFYLDSVGYDGGYGDFFYNPLTLEYVQCSYRSPTSLFDASLKQYNFSLSFEDYNILIEDDFADGTIDTAKWDVTDPADGVTISETGSKLRFAANPASPVASTNTNYVASDLTFNQATRVFRCSVARSNDSVNQSALIKIYNPTDTFATARQIQISKGVGNKIQLRIYNGSTFIYDLLTAIDWDKAIKIVIESNNDIKFYYFDSVTTLAWVQMGTTQNYNLGGAVKMSLQANSSGSDTGSPNVEFDTVFVTDYNYLNTIPY